MAHLSIIATAAPASGHLQGRPALRFSGVALAPIATKLRQDIRLLTPTTGTITDTVVLVAGGIEIPFANGRVWLLRAADGYKAWEGYSDAAGNYTATGLELGVKYVVVGIDPYGNQKATGAGPVTATLPTP